MTTLSELLRKIESAGGADRELDLALGRLWPTPQPFSLSINQQRGGKPPVFAFTASIDAALALVERVLPGCNGSIHFGEPHRNPFAHLAPLRIDGRHPVDGAGANIALAVLATLLRAKLSEQGEGS